MTVVKPPAFEELVKTYGSQRAAIQYLIDAGFTPEEIEWKWAVPYHRIRLFMTNTKLENPTSFSSVVKTYERAAVLRSQKGKETELAKFFQRDDLGLEMKTRLALGLLSEESLRIGQGTIERAISLATGTPLREVRKLLRDYGEHGDVVFLLQTPQTAVLTVDEVYQGIRLLPELSKISERNLHVASLLRSGTPEEDKYVVRLLLGDLKLGYHQRTVIRAAARAYKVPIELLESASAIVGLTESIILAPKGELQLSTIKLRPGQFVKPQLAQLYEPDKADYPIRAEHKLDGSRLQIHKWGSRVWLYSRRGNEKSQTLPEIAKIAAELNAHSCIVDSEIVAVDEDGRFLPFQYLLERTVPQQLPAKELETRKERTHVTIRAFDILFLNGSELLDLPLSTRGKYLSAVVPTEYLVEGRECSNEIDLMTSYEEALNKGLEGIVVKALQSPYEPGRRTYTWLKLKPERDTIDCTIVKALYGKGKRAGWYSSFLLAARDPEKKKLYTIGKVSNLADDVMERLRNIVETTSLSHDDEGVFVKPSIVVEATYQEIQETDEYTSGYALRVPKIVRFRSDKQVEDIDDIKKLSKLFEMQYDRHLTKSLERAGKSA